MQIAVVGTGYVGLVTGTCLAAAGHKVRCIDIDAAKVAQMQAGQIPIYEPGLQTIFQAALKSGSLSVTTDLATGIEQAAVIFLALPTPPNADGSADLSAVLRVAEQLGPLLKDYAVVVDKSTVPVGTADQVKDRIASGTDVTFDVVSNPEFLREGLAVKDFRHPDRIVIGTDSARAEAVMREVYATFIDQPEQLVVMDVKSAELTKYAANSFLAMKVSFMNEIANLAEKLGADVESVRRGIGPDQRIGTAFLRAGIGFGGSCFPKDVLALNQTSQQVGYDFKLLQGVLAVNHIQKGRLLSKLQAYYETDDIPETASLAGKHFATWGLSFKPDTDDIREAPSLNLIDGLLGAGATVTVYDPQAMANVQRHLGVRDGLRYAASALEAAIDADALLITTEWDEFQDVALHHLKTALKHPVIFDGRNMYEPRQMLALGFTYHSIGRPTRPPTLDR